MGAWQGRVEGRGGNKREEEGASKVSSHPYVRNPEKYPDCTTDLIGGDGNTDVCPGRQTTSRRHQWWWGVMVVQCPTLDQSREFHPRAVK